jgi:N-acetylmuramoyl-L-alanine amidase
VKQAGFYVLVGASMPSVLIETGFISNKGDAKFLKSAAGQNQLAESIFSSIKSYRKYYEEAMDAEF